MMMQLIKRQFSQLIFSSFARSPSADAGPPLSGRRKPLTRFCLLAGLAMVLAACGPSEPESEEPAVEISEQVADAASDMRTGATGSAGSQEFETFLQDVFQQELEASPLFKTQIGMIDDDLEAYGQWDDFSDQGAIDAHQRTQRYLAEMRDNFSLESLTPQEQLTYRFMEFEWQMDDRQFQVRDSQYAFSPMQDVLSSLVTFLINNHRVSSEAHADAYLSRLQGLDTVINSVIEEAERRAADGVLLPSFAYPRLLSSAQAMITGAEFGNAEEPSALLADFNEKVDALDVSAERAEELKAAGSSAMTDIFAPAVERYMASLRDMESQSDGRDGVWKLPNGEAFYASQLNLYTTRDDLSAQQIHDIGLAEVARIQDEMRTIMTEVGFDGTLAEFFEYLRTDPQFYLPNTSEGRQQYLDDSTAMIEQVMEVAPQYFDTLPEAALEVRAVEPFREATATGAFYNQPALDGSRPGYYYVNLSNMNDNPTYLMESLAYHEGAPGHHFQLALAQELEELPMLQRLTFYSAYVEGWGLYAEQLGKDMGFFTDPYKDFGRLSYEIFRAARLVVDTGIHHLRWTRQEAIDYMMANTPMTEGDITPEVERYIVWPGQAVSYKIGMMTILELRELARQELGDRFSWGGFHDAVLTAGSLPLPLLAERVEAWIESEQQP
jgi:uncharacterized protein (DUF885 family)